MGRDITLDAALADYLNSISVEEPELLQKLRHETADLGDIAVMQIGWTQARFMQLLAMFGNVRRYLEIGVFTGYSSLAMALSLPSDGKILALDVDENWTGIARRYWAEAGVEDKIDLRIGNAQNSLTELMETPDLELFDMAFIDADKESLSFYFDAAIRLCRKGGMIIVDNVLWSGEVINLEDQRESTKSIRKFNQSVMQDDRVFLSTVAVGDGMTLAIKR